MSQATGARILIVEDDRDIAQLLERVFQLGGYTSVWAPSGRKAIAALETQRPDLITLDLNLPELSGIDVLMHVRGEAHHPLIPVLVLTSREELPEEVSTWADSVMIKPFDVAALLTAVAELLATASSQARAIGE